MRLIRTDRIPDFAWSRGPLLIFLDTYHYWFLICVLLEGRRRYASVALVQRQGGDFPRLRFETKRYADVDWEAARRLA